MHKTSLRAPASRSGKPWDRRRHRSVRPCVEQLEARCLLSGMNSLLDDNPHNIAVMSRNLYLGADLGVVLEVAQSGTPLEIAAAVGQLWGDIYDMDSPARAEAFAEEIAAAQPQLVGLQEVSLFEAGPVYDLNGVPVPGTAETIDYLDILLENP